MSLAGRRGWRLAMVAIGAGLRSGHLAACRHPCVGIRVSNAGDEGWRGIRGVIDLCVGARGAASREVAALQSDPADGRRRLMFATLRSYLDVV